MNQQRILRFAMRSRVRKGARRPAAALALLSAVALISLNTSKSGLAATDTDNVHEDRLLQREIDNGWRLVSGDVGGDKAADVDEKEQDEKEKDAVELDKELEKPGEPSADDKKDKEKIAKEEHEKDKEKIAKEEHEKDKEKIAKEEHEKNKNQLLHEREPGKAPVVAFADHNELEVAKGRVDTYTFNIDANTEPFHHRVVDKGFVIDVVWAPEELKLSLVATNTLQLHRRVSLIEFRAKEGDNNDQVFQDKEIVAPFGQHSVFLAFTKEDLEKSVEVIPRLYFRPADYRSCKNDFCFSINAVDEEHDVVRAWNKRLEDITLRFSYDCSDCTFVNQDGEELIAPVVHVLPGRHHGVRESNDSAALSPPVSLGWFKKQSDVGGSDMDYKWHYRFSTGNQFAQPVDVLYRLPFRETDDNVFVSQTAGGCATHQAKNAYDFAMPQGTDVLAARAGVVLFVEDKNKYSKFDKGICPKPVTMSCSTPLSDANRILIVHDDGTVAQYAHLKHKGAKVSVGDYVSAGDLIGWSGNTGFSTGPHLHFETSIYGREGTTIPVRFRDPEKKIDFDDTALPKGWTSTFDTTGKPLYFPNFFLHSHATEERPKHELAKEKKEVEVVPQKIKEKKETQSGEERVLKVTTSDKESATGQAAVVQKFFRERRVLEIIESQTSDAAIDLRKGLKFNEKNESSK